VGEVAAGGEVEPMKVSPGFISAMNTAWFAWLPEFGWTLAKAQSNRRQARSMAKVSARSTKPQPA
jgi:hypothetical protein